MSGDEQLTHGPDGQLAAVLARDIQLVVGQGPADGDPFVELVNRLHGGEDGAFRGSVSIGEDIALRRVEGHQLFSANAQVLDRRVIDSLGEHAAHLGRHKDVGDPLVREVLVQLVQVEAELLRHDADAGTCGQCGPEVHHAGVKAKAGIRSHDRAGHQLVVRPIPVAEVDQVSVLQHDALWLAGRAGRVQEDEEVAGLDRRRRDIAFRKRRDVLRGERRPLVVGQQVREVGVRDEQLGLCVGNHVLQALGRIAGIQGLIRRAGLQDAQRRHCHVLAAGDQDGDDILLTDA